MIFQKSIRKSKWAMPCAFSLDLVPFDPLQCVETQIGARAVDLIPLKCRVDIYLYTCVCVCVRARALA